MKRRAFLVVSSGGVLSLSGCIQWDGSSDPACPIRGEITALHATFVDDVSADASITDSTDERIAENEVVQTVLERANSGETVTVNQSGDEYERARVDRDDFDQEALEDTVCTVRELPENDDTYGPYVRHRSQVVVLGHSGDDSSVVEADTPALEVGEEADT